MAKKRTFLYWVFAAVGVLLCLFTIQDGNIVPEVSNNAYIGVPLPAWQFGIRPYGAVLVLAFTVFSVIVFCLSDQKCRYGFPAFAALSAWMSILVSRLVFVLVNASFYFNVAGMGSCFRIWDGGFSMTRALTGILLSWLILQNDGPSARSVALALPFFILLSRLGETFTTTGLGIGFDDPGILTVEGEWDYPLNVRLIEAFVAFLIFFPLLCLTRKEKSPKNSRSLLIFLVLYGSLQILLESLRNDGHMIWGFVKSQQIFSFVAAAAAAVILTHRRGHLLCSVISSVCLGGLVFFIEKALDRNWLHLPIYVIYLAFFMLIIGYMLITLLPEIKKKE